MSETIREAIVEALGRMDYDVSDVTGDTILGPAGLDLESLAVAELAALMEDTYGFKFTDADMEAFANMTLDQFAAEVSTRAQPAMAGDQPE